MTQFRAGSLMLWNNPSRYSRGIVTRIWTKNRRDVDPTVRIFWDSSMREADFTDDTIRSWIRQNMIVVEVW